MVLRNLPNDLLADFKGLAICSANACKVWLRRAAEQLEAALPSIVLHATVSTKALQALVLQVEAAFMMGEMYRAVLSRHELCATNLTMTEFLLRSGQGRSC